MEKNMKKLYIYMCIYIHTHTHTHTYIYKLNHSAVHHKLKNLKNIVKLTIE